MLVETPTPLPYAGAVWVGGHWVWEGNWVWAAGRWAAPPRPDCLWVHPYYEHRDGAVVFITGHWGAAGVAFVPPALNLNLTLVSAAPGVVPGPRPIGPQGVFVPPPPGSRAGLIVPAPIGTPPAVVTSAAPVVNVGMRIQNNNTTVNNTRVTNVTNITNVTNVTIVAPASATASGKGFESSVPAQAHLAAALPAVVRAPAPVPVSAKPIPAFVPGRAPVVLPAPQMVHSAAATEHAASPSRPTTPAVTTPPVASTNGTPGAAISPTPVPSPKPTPTPVAPPAAPTTSMPEHINAVPVPPRPGVDTPHTAMPGASAPRGPAEPSVAAPSKPAVARHDDARAC
jgi:hypothetical protein